MKFLNFGFLAISSLLTASYAAPTIQDAKQGDVVNSPQLANVSPNLDLDVLSDRDVDEASQVQGKLQTCIISVKQHTGKINETCSGYQGKQISESDKQDIIKIVRQEIRVVFQLVSGLVKDINDLSGEALKITSEQNQTIVGLVVELILEIVCTLDKVLKLLSCTIFELLGPLLSLLCNVLTSLLTSLGFLIEGLLELVKDLLSGVLGLVGNILTGLNLDNILGSLTGAL